MSEESSAETATQVVPSKPTTHDPLGQEAIKAITSASWEGDARIPVGSKAKLDDKGRLAVRRLLLRFDHATYQLSEVAVPATVESEGPALTVGVWRVLGNELVLSPQKNSSVGYSFAVDFSRPVHLAKIGNELKAIPNMKQGAGQKDVDVWFTALKPTS